MEQALNYYSVGTSTSLPELMTAGEINWILKIHTAGNDNKEQIGYADITPNHQGLHNMLGI